MKDLKKSILEATDNGLGIITDNCPQAAAVTDNIKKAFSYRPDDRTPSAYLYPPTDTRPYWIVKDYGGEGATMSPFDVYMDAKGYSQHDFNAVLHELAQQYGVTENLDPKVNCPKVVRRNRNEGEVPGMYFFETREGFNESELLTWGPKVKAEHLAALGWQSVEHVDYVKNDGVTERHSTDNYPVFAQRCPYIEDGEQKVFHKLYEPKNPDKAKRFRIVGNMPKDYLYGLQALKSAYYANGEERLDVACLVSGGSDGANCLSMGYQPVWLMSETAELSEQNYKELLKYVRKVVVIPDADATGVSNARRHALKFLDISVAWLPDEVLKRFRDNRGRQRKNLKDYVTLYPYKADFAKLIQQAKKARFWDEVRDDKNGVRYTVSVTRLNYFLELNGFGTLRVEGRDKPQYISFDGMIVRKRNAADPTLFLRDWMRAQGLPEVLMDKVLVFRGLPSEKKSLLKEYTLSFDSYTPDTQCFYFRNKWVEVSAEGIREFTYKATCNGDRYVWADSVINHDYKRFAPMFEWERQEDGTLSFKILDTSSEFFQYLMNASRIHWRKEDEEGIQLTEDEQEEELLCLLNKIYSIGYLLHQYKSASRAWAVLVQDNKISSSESESNGRSGKTILLRMMQELSPSFFIDGRQFSVNKSFIFDGVTADTALMVIDDCQRNFPFPYFFSMITEKMRIEEKGNHQFTIPFEKTPKLLMASNFVLPAQDASTMGRILPVVFSDYYHQKAPNNDYKEDRSVSDSFGHNIVDMAYPEELWSRDIAFIMQCVQFYLAQKDTNERMMPPMGNIKKRQSRQLVGDSFQDWADEFTADPANLDVELSRDNVYSAYSTEVGKEAVSSQNFTKRLKEYCFASEHIDCYNPADITGKAKDGERLRRKVNGNDVAYIYIRSKAAAEKMKEASGASAPASQQELF